MSTTSKQKPVFDYKTTEGKYEPTMSDRRVARALREHRRIRKLSWRAYTRKIAVWESYGTQMDRLLYDDIVDIVDRVGSDGHYVEQDDEGNVFIKNEFRSV